MDKQIDNIVKHAEVSEKAIERYLVEAIKSLGGICLKYSNPGMVGYPDRVALLPGGKTVWIELKSKGRHPSRIQRTRFAQMASKGHPVHIADSKESINEILKPFHHDL